MITGCTKCGRVIHEGEVSWDIDGGLCQECWEEYCAEMWRKTGWGSYEPIEFKPSSESE